MKEYKPTISIKIANKDTIELIHADMDKRGISQYIKWIDEVIHELNTNAKFSNGTAVKDKITGYSGTVTGCCNYYGNKQSQYLIENIDSTGRPIEWWIDEDRLEAVQDSED